MAKQRRQYGTFLQRMVREQLEELALAHRRIAYPEALDYIGQRLPRQSAWYSLTMSDPRRILPPGCRMTATHFEFS